MTAPTPIIDTQNVTTQTAIRFRSLTLEQAADGSYTGHLQYVKETKLGNTVLSAEMLDGIDLGQAQLLASAEGQQAFPLIQLFCRKAQAAATPDLFEPVT